MTKKQKLMNFVIIIQLSFNFFYKICGYTKNDKERKTL